MWLEGLGLASTAVILYGTFRISGVNSNGWLLRALGDGGWIVFGVISGHPSIIISEAAFIVVDLAGYWNFRRRLKDFRRFF